MVKRATIADVAKAAGVSVATVDRALTGRLPVRRDTAERIAAVAEEVGFHAAGLIASRLAEEEPARRIGILLQNPGDAFYAAFARSLEQAVGETRLLRGSFVLDHWITPEPDEIADRLKRLAKRVDAVAVVSPDHPTITAAVEDVVRGGTPVVSLLSDFAVSARSGHVGVDNKKAGRTAAWAIANCARRPGKVVVFVGSHRFHGHELREIGFRSYFREHAPDFTLIETPATMESGAVAHRTMRDLLAAHDDLVGAYVAGGGMEGAISALREAGGAARTILVCSASTPDSRQALLDGTVRVLVAEPVETICRRLVEMVAAILASPSAATPRELVLPVVVLTPENL